MTTPTARAVNWNRIIDEKDEEVWNKLTTNFWLPEKIPISNDLPSWETLTEPEKLLTQRVFTGLTLLDTIQGTVGSVSLIPDAATPHEEAVLTNIAFMERFGGNTELLTNEGWLAISKVTLNHKVAQYIPETNTLEFVNPIRIYEPEWRDETYIIETGHKSGRQEVSAGHRIYYEEKKKINNTCKEWNSKTCTAKELLNINLNTNTRRFRATGVSSVAENFMNSVDKLLVAIQADGSFSTRLEQMQKNNRDTIPCKFNLAKTRKIDRLQQLCKDAGWEVHEVPPKDKLSARNFTVAVPAKFVPSRAKLFREWFDITQVSKEWAQDFITECGLWGGHFNKKYNSVTYCTAVKDNSDFFSAVAALTGKRCKTTIRKDERQNSYQDSYVSHVTDGKSTYDAQTMIIKRGAPQIMYCVQVPSTYLLTRNGGSTVISGNCVHAKSYSNIFSTLCSSREIDEAFRWSEENQFLQKKANTVLQYYNGGDPLKRKIVSTLLESFLFYSGFYLPMYWASRAKLPNTADMIRLIIRDEAIHGYYIGYKYQRMLENETTTRQHELHEYTINTLLDLYDNEIAYTHSLYNMVGLTADVSRFLRYNANKALMNLGYDALFPAHDTIVNPVIIAALAPNGNENHDFFSGSGSSYVIGKTEHTVDEDWDF